MDIKTVALVASTVDVLVILIPHGNFSDLQIVSRVVHLGDVSGLNVGTTVEEYGMDEHRTQFERGGKR